MGEHVVRDHDPARLEQRSGQGEEALVVGLLRVEEDEVEDVLGPAQGRVGVALDELRPLLEPCLGDVPPPGGAARSGSPRARRPALQHARPRREPDRRVAARATDLEHLDTRLRRREREQEATGARPHLARALRRRQPGLALGPSSASRRARTERTRSSGTQTPPRGRRPLARARPTGETPEGDLAATALSHGARSPLRRRRPSRRAR